MGVLKRWIDRVSDRKRRYSSLTMDVVATLEQQVLLFPVFVVVLASMAFVFGGRCAGWQWWSAACLSLIIPLRGKSVGVAFYSFVAFVFLFLLMALFSYLDTDLFMADHSAYHMPAIRMLIEGWNPLFAATPQGIQSQFGIDPWDMKLLEVLFCHKFVWIFDAVAYYFHGDSLAITLPAEYFVLWAVMLTSLRVLRCWGLGSRFVFLLFLSFSCFHKFAFVDSIVGLAGFGLLLSMTATLRSGRFQVIHMVAYSVIMIGAKASGMISCFVFWVVFSLFMFSKDIRNWKRLFWRFTALACVIFGLFVIVCSSPYLTAWHDYGHPFYPFQTADEEKHPKLDMIADFNAAANADRLAMGSFGLFVNAYISPDLAKWFYCRKLNKTVFSPTCRVWLNGQHYSNGRKSASCPTERKERICLLLTLAVLLLSSSFRMVGVAMCLALIPVPSYLYGCLRYFCWLDVAFFFALCLIGEWVCRKVKWVNMVYLVCVGVMCCLIVLVSPIQIARDVRRKTRMAGFSPENIFCQTTAPNHLAYVMARPMEERERLARTMSSSSHADINNFKLLAMRLKNFKAEKIFPLREEDAAQYAYNSDWCVYFPQKEKQVDEGAK